MTPGFVSGDTIPSQVVVDVMRTPPLGFHRRESSMYNLNTRIECFFLPFIGSHDTSQGAMPWWFSRVVLLNTYGWYLRIFWCDTFPLDIGLTWHFIRQGCRQAGRQPQWSRNAWMPQHWMTQCEYLAFYATLYFFVTLLSMKLVICFNMSSWIYISSVRYA